MSVTNQIPRDVSVAAPGATIFPYGFKVGSKFDLLVQVDGVTKVVDVDYTVSGVGLDAGGDITFVLPMGGGETVMRKRNMVFQRLNDYQNLGDLRSATLNNDQDDPIMMIQQLAESDARSLKLPLDSTADAQLPAPVALYGLRWNAVAGAIENYEITPYGGVGGADLIGFKQYGAGMILRTLQAKGRDIVHADDRGLAGDASDETTALQNLLDAAVGKMLMLGAGKTYGIGATGITIPANTKLIANGSKFKKLAASATYGITTLGAFECDRLTYETVGGASDAGIQIKGSDVRIGKLSATSIAANSGGNGLLIFDSDAATIRNIWIGELQLTEWAGPFRTRNVDGIYVGPVTMDNYKTGYYCHDTKNGVFDGAHIFGLSPTSVGGAGDNGLLIESTADFKTENLTFRGWHVEDSGEHAFRIGGDRVVRNMWFIGCSSTNTGCMPADASTGGAAFKVLHGNTNPTYHENINVIGFDAVDCSNSAGGLDNMAAFQIGKVKGGQFSNCTIRKRNNTYSCKFGFQVLASEDIEINNPNITDCMRHAFQFIQAAVVSPAYPTTMTRVHVNGGHGQVMESGNGSAVAKWTVAGGTFTDVSIKGTTLSNGGAACLHDTPTGGSYVDCEVDCTYRAPLNTAGGPPFSNSNSILFRVKSPYYGTFAPTAANGSIYQDTTNGAIRIRKAGAWTTL